MGPEFAFKLETLKNKPYEQSIFNWEYHYKNEDHKPQCYSFTEKTANTQRKRIVMKKGQFMKEHKTPFL